jgi:hypothetical protein
MRLLAGVVAVLATGCLSSPSHGDDEVDAAPGGADAAGEECPAAELPDFAPDPDQVAGNVLSLDFDDTSDHVFHDRSGYRRDVAQLATSRKASVDTQHGRAIELALDSSHVSVPDDAAFDLQSFTIEMWIRRVDASAATVLFSDYVEGVGTAGAE